MLLLELFLILEFGIIGRVQSGESMSKCETVGFPGPNESWIKIRSNRNLVEYKLTCGQKQFWFQDPIFSKYIVDIDPDFADKWECGYIRNEVFWSCNLTTGNWTSSRGEPQCFAITDKECCFIWSRGSNSPPVSQPSHCISTCLWHLLRDPDNGYRRWNITRSPHVLAPQATTVYYHCNEGYHIVGNPNVVCTAGTTWTSVPTCEKDESFLFVFHAVVVTCLCIFAGVIFILGAMSFRNRQQWTTCKK